MAKLSCAPSDAPSADPPSETLHVTFLHLDLGIGGAEQLIVNAAVALQQLEHHVTIWTTHHDASHCFGETRGAGSLASHIHIAGDWLPRHVLGRFTAMCAVIRMLYLALVVWISTLSLRKSSCQRSERKKGHIDRRVDVVICDGVSAMIPLLRYVCGFPVLFYCHFPDKLLCTNRASVWKRFYRAPLDWLEEKTTGAATLIAVNSLFTAKIFAETFPRLLSRHPAPAVIHPAINLGRFVPPKAGASAFPTHDTTQEGTKGAVRKEDAHRPFVSLNRFERKKNIGLALEALALLRTRLETDWADGHVDGSSSLRLVIAGGYDEAVRENREYMDDLQARASALGVAESVSFQPSISDSERAALLQDALAVLYTPDREHFGIVPLEAMYAGSPVVAVASGGPLETVVDGTTGFLCQGDPEGFANAMYRFVVDPTLKETMGAAGHVHVKENFGLDMFAKTLEGAVLDTRRQAQRERDDDQGERREIMISVTGITILLLACGLYHVFYLS
ncbi:hypothetical protein NSK_004759 [Nannochloropsis salina CCMP1776]|jgi:glycosyltransferase involved in cell wall biosynthesis|uniref:Alpha-1,3/1,6-mannosyltransferase ALG2 n=1 Tax=Nannochloropsis salina CCMP1776 TaxID=1027361 RepID=A0A4D9D2I6_9STRA|nr:hypothetical protein NSK_004759 [Nannochloropsis salina CCMP1776]|eukprot:TFJ83655.1 hypothetical protein NSK_004759 [Nannochloropsis salina CCMP1776]